MDLWSWLYGFMVYGFIILWLYGFMVLRFYGFMVSWFYSFMVLWFYGCMVLSFYAVVVLWFYGFMFCSFMVLWFYGFLVSKNTDLPFHVFRRILVPYPRFSRFYYTDRRFCSVLVFSKIVNMLDHILRFTNIIFLKMFQGIFLIALKYFGNK